MADAFCDTLMQAERDLSQNAAAYPDLSPRSQQACKERLQQALDLLQKLQTDLGVRGASSAGTSSDAAKNEVQVVGLRTNKTPSVEHFKRSLEAACWSPGPFTLHRERNYILHAPSKHPTKSNDDEFFLVFASASDADFALDLGAKALRIRFDEWTAPCTITFGKPTQDQATRATWRRIGELVDRIEAIEAELTAMGAVREYSIPKLPSNYLDKSWFAESIPKAKRLRASGASLDHHTYAPLKSFTMVDRAPIEARVRALYDEECDALIALREFQCEGFDFKF